MNLELVDEEFLNDGLTLIANTIRERGDATGLLSFPEGMANAIPTKGGGGVPVPSPIVSGNTPVWQDKSWPTIRGTTMTQMGSSFVCKRSGTYQVYLSLGMSGTSRFALEHRIKKKGESDWQTDNVLTTKHIHSVDYDWIRDYMFDTELEEGDEAAIFATCSSSIWAMVHTISIDWDNTF